MSGRGSDGPAVIGEEAFRSNLRDAVTVWRQRLERAGAGPRESEGIGREAAELRTVAESRGWWALAQHLANVESLSREGVTTLQAAVVALARRLTPGEAAPAPNISSGIPVRQPGESSISFGAQSIALPPLLDDPVFARPDPAPPSPSASAPNREPPPTAISPPDPAGSPEPVAVRAPSGPKPPPVAHSPAPPDLLVKRLLQLDAFGKKESESESVAKGARPLGLGRPTPLSGPSIPSQVAPPPRLDRKPLQPDTGGSVRPSSPSRPPAVSAPKRPAGRTPARARRLQAGVPTWFYALGGAVALLAFATVLIVVKNTWHGTDLNVDAGPKPAPRPIPDPGPPTGSPTSAPTIDRPVEDQTTERLRKVIEAQVRLAKTCQGDSCLSPWTKFARETMVHPGPGIIIEPSPASEPLPPWLRKLRKPDDFPLVDDPLLKGTFDYDAKHVKGHPLFQNTINRCCVYSDIIDGALVKYGVPAWLAAVVYQESQCDPKARSPVGALGLWQFMPESARAYDLQVIEDEVDERMNPVKATDAAVRFLADLQRKLGAWDLALAAYNAGPYGVAARVAQVGGHAAFWDLVRSDLLPDETARYVPAIEAQALILHNLAALDFLVQCQVEDATEVRANPGTRLSLVARAANTSTRRIHELNLDLLEDVVPTQENAVRVPTTEAPHAQQFLDQADPHDTRDTCVPDTFDWGHTNFEDSPYAKGCGHGAPQ
jgi:hypothetical protein